MLNEADNNSPVFGECVSGALIKRSLAEPKKQPRRRGASGAHKHASKKLEHDEEEASDLAEFAEVWLVNQNIMQRLRRSSSTSPQRYLPLYLRISKVSHTQASRNPQNWPINTLTLFPKRPSMTSSPACPSQSPTLYKHTPSSPTLHHSPTSLPPSSPNTSQSSQLHLPNGLTLVLQPVKSASAVGFLWRIITWYPKKHMQRCSKEAGMRNGCWIASHGYVGLVTALSMGARLMRSWQGIGGVWKSWWREMMWGPGRDGEAVYGGRKSDRIRFGTSQEIYHFSKWRSSTFTPTLPLTYLSSFLASATDGKSSQVIFIRFMVLDRCRESRAPSRFLQRCIWRMKLFHTITETLRSLCYSQLILPTSVMCEEILSLSRLSNRILYSAHLFYAQWHHFVRVKVSLAFHSSGSLEVHQSASHELLFQRPINGVFTLL